MVSEMWKSAKMPLEEVPLQFPITILCAERQLGQKNRVNEIYKEIEKMLKRRLPACTINLQKISLRKRSSWNPL